MAIIKNPITIVNQGGGGPKLTGAYRAVAIDYDGTLLKEEWLDNGDVFELPTTPTYADITFKKWFCNEQVVNNKVTINNNDVLCVAGYYTKSGLSEFEIELNESTGLTIEFYARTIQDTRYLQNDTIYWGDGTSETATTRGYKSHTYSTYGTYIIKTDTDFTNTFSATALFNQYYSIENYSSYTVGNMICKSAKLANFNTEIDLGSWLIYCCNLDKLSLSMPLVNSKLAGSRLTHIVDLETNLNYLSNNPISVSKYCKYVLYEYGTKNMYFSSSNFYSLEMIALPKTLQKISLLSVSNSIIKQLIIPSQVSGFTNSSFTLSTSRELRKINIENLSSFSGINLSDAYMLKNIILTTNNCQCLLKNCWNLEEITLPEGMTTIASNQFGFCYRIKQVVFPSTISSIGTQAFTNDYACSVFDFTKCTSIPTLSSSNAFYYIKFYQILVPSTLYNQWITETNWVDVASHIVSVTV